MDQLNATTVSENVTDPTTDDPRVQEISEILGRSPEDVLAFAQDLADEDGNESVSDELNDGVEFAEAVAAGAEI